MPCVSVQFHMLFDELVDFVTEMMTRYSLAVELERFFPTTTHVVTSPDSLSAEINRFGHVDRMWFLCKPPRARKYEKFNLLVGLQKDRNLEQSHLGAGTDKAEAFRTLKSIAYQLKKRTLPGTDFGTLKIFRVSPGAASAARAGKLVLAGIGGVGKPGAGQRSIVRQQTSGTRTEENSFEKTNEQGGEEKSTRPPDEVAEV